MKKAKMVATANFQSMRVLKKKRYKYSTYIYSNDGGKLTQLTASLIKPIRNTISV